jgi:ADP-dependent NAD(P)H-hydrate dehydratase / NAD(P)H-hydrate epimerase
VLTPHAGEAERLLDALAQESPDASATVPDARRDPLRAALRLAEAWQAVCVLKGPGTVIADPGGRWTISAAGTPALATGGSGDVLAGVIAAFLAAAVTEARRHLPAGRDGMLAGGEGPPGFDAFAVAAAATHLHGRAGELAARRGPGLVAGDVIAALPRARRRHG